MGVVLPDVIELASGLTEVELRLAEPFGVLVCLAFAFGARGHASNPLEPPLFKLAGQRGLSRARAADEIQDVFVSYVKPFW